MIEPNDNKKRNIIITAVNTMWDSTLLLMECMLYIQWAYAILLLGIAIPIFIFFSSFFITITIANRSCYIKPVVQSVYRISFTTKLQFVVIIILCCQQSVLHFYCLLFAFIFSSSVHLFCCLNFMRIVTKNGERKSKLLEIHYQYKIFSKQEQKRALL